MHAYKGERDCWLISCQLLALWIVTGRCTIPTTYPPVSTVRWGLVLKQPFPQLDDLSQVSNILPLHLGKYGVLDVYWSDECN